MARQNDLTGMLSTHLKINVTFKCRKLPRGYTAHADVKANFVIVPILIRKDCESDSPRMLVWPTCCILQKREIEIKLKTFHAHSKRVHNLSACSIAHNVG